MELTIEVQDEQEAAAIMAVIAERRRQDDKFGKQDHDPAWWMVILGEEYGETCQAVCEYRWSEAIPSNRTRAQRIDHAMAEATQVSAVAVAMIQSILRMEWKDEITTVLPSDRRKVLTEIGVEGPNYEADDDDDTSIGERMGHPGGHYGN